MTDSEAGWRLTEHTADVGILAWGASAASVFEQAALAMLSLMIDPATVTAREERVIEVDSPAQDLLLAAFLNELLYLVEGGRFVPASVRAELHEKRPVAAPPRGAPAAPRADATSWRARATVHGETLDPERHQVRLVVKAATLHELSLIQSEGRWEGTVLLDV